MKKLTSVLLSVVMLMSVLCMPALATEQDDYLQAAVSVDVDAGTVALTFTANEDTTNGKIVIEYNAGYLNVEETDIAGIVTNTTESAGSLTLSYATTTAGTIKAGETVATVLFSVAQNRSCALSVTVKEFNAHERLNSVILSTKLYLANTLGDVNDDGKVNTRDVIIILQAIAARTTDDFTDMQFAAADVNHDGVINTRDAITILRAIASKTTLK